MNIVPSDDPVAMAMTHTAKKVNAQKKPPPTPMMSASHTKPAEMLASFTSAENMPMMSRSRRIWIDSLAPA